MVISSIFCHNITGNGGGGSQHDKDRHQLLVPVAEKDGEREEKGGKQDQLDKRGDGSQSDFFDCFSALEPGANGDQCQWCGGGADTADRFIQKSGKF